MVSVGTYLRTDIRNTVPAGRSRILVGAESGARADVTADLRSCRSTSRMLKCACVYEWTGGKLLECMSRRLVAWLCVSVKRRRPLSVVSVFGSH